MTCEIIEGDCLAVMRGMADNSFDAIVTDPPYFKVKGEAWDRQWEKPTQFLAWIGDLCEQWQRLLKPNGSLYCFASSKMAARVECRIAERFSVLSHIVWQKGDENGNGMHTRQHKEGCRIWFPQTERIIFAEHYGADNIAKGEAGYVAKCDELRGFVFEPLRAYIAGEFERAGMLNAAGKIAANVACGFSASAGGMASRHYFSRSQWQLPTRQHYHAMRELLHLRGNWEQNAKQGFLRREYEDLRRPFSVTADVPYTDVWTFPTVQHYKGKHPCEKPLAMMEHIVRASTRPGAAVLDCFAGSGVTGQACQRLARDFVGIELDAKYANMARARIAAASPSRSLFAV